MSGHLAARADRQDHLATWTRDPRAASPGPYRLMLADAAILRALIARASGQREAELAAAREAYELAWLDGPPFTYHRTLGQAREPSGKLASSRRTWNRAHWANA